MSDRIRHLSGLPIPDHLARIFGYTGNRKQVAFYWQGNDLVYADGEFSSTQCNWYAWQQFTANDYVKMHLGPFHLYGIDDLDTAQDGLLIDTSGGHGRLEAGPVDALLERVRRQKDPERAPDHPPHEMEIETGQWLKQMWERLPSSISATETMQLNRDLQQWMKTLPIPLDRVDHTWMN